MDSGMVEENGNSSLDPMAGPTAASADNGSTTTVLTSGANIVQLIPSTGSAIQVSIVLYINKNFAFYVCVYIFFLVLCLLFLYNSIHINIIYKFKLLCFMCHYDIFAFYNINMMFMAESVVY